MLRRCETLQLPAMCTVTCTSIADTCSHVPKHVPGGNQRLPLQQTHESRARNVRLCKPCPDCTRANSCKRAAPIQAPAALVQARAPDGSPIPAVHSMRMLCSVSCEPRASCRANHAYAVQVLDLALAGHVQCHVHLLSMSCVRTRCANSCIGSPSANPWGTNRTVKAQWQNMHRQCATIACSCW